MLLFVALLFSETVFLPLQIFASHSGNNNVCWRMKWNSHPFLSTHKGAWLIMGPLYSPPLTSHPENEPQIKLRWNFILFPFEAFSTSLWKPLWDLSCFSPLHTLCSFALPRTKKANGKIFSNNNLTRSIFDIVIWTADYNGLSVLKRKKILFFIVHWVLPLFMCIFKRRES